MKKCIYCFRELPEPKIMYCTMTCRSHHRMEVNRIFEPPIQDLEDEVWMDAVGFEKHHMVSNKGRIKRKAYIWSRTNDNVNHLEYERLVPISFRGKYKHVALKQNNGVVKTHTVHRIVALSFIINPENKEYVNHIDGNKGNNDLTNLEWVTNKENCEHASRIGLLPMNENHPCAILKNTDVVDIKKMLKDGESPMVISKQYNVSDSAIHCIKANRTWKNI